MCHCAFTTFQLEQVLRMRLRWPGNFIRYGFESYSGSDVNRDPESLLVPDDSSTASEAYIEMPATTLQLDLSNLTGSSDEESEDDRLPLIYEIPEFMRRNRRHELRPLSPALSPTSNNAPHSNESMRHLHEQVSEESVTGSSSLSIIHVRGNAMRSQKEGSYESAVGSSTLSVDHSEKGQLHRQSSEESITESSTLSVNRARSHKLMPQKQVSEDSTTEPAALLANLNEATRGQVYPPNSKPPMRQSSMFSVNHGRLHGLSLRKQDSEDSTTGSSILSVNCSDASGRQLYAQDSGESTADCSASSLNHVQTATIPTGNDTTSRTHPTSQSQSHRFAQSTQYYEYTL